MNKREFIKLHGAGNDFVFMDVRDTAGVLTASRAARLCHRHFGIGADGIVAWTGEDAGRPRMKIYNLDGSVPEMCGNGLRCFVKALVDSDSHASNPLAVVTDAGVMVCDWKHQGDETLVDVLMGPVRTFDAREPLAMDAPVEMLEIAGRTISFRGASTGNPHIVLLDPAENRERLGPILSTHPRFPEGTNVGFARVVSSRHLELVVCERGVGFTLACGTGAVAATAVAVSARIYPAGEPVEVTLPGGTLYVTISADFSTARLRGPAVEVYRGSIDLEGVL